MMRHGHRLQADTQDDVCEMGSTRILLEASIYVANYGMDMLAKWTM